MATFKAPRPQGRRVWRISEHAPLGEWVDPSGADDNVPPPELPEVSSGGWVISSFDLLHGTDISENGEGDTVPGELLDELFAQPEQTPKDRPK